MSEKNSNNMLSGDNNNNSKCGCLCSSSLTSSTGASKYVLCEDIQTPGLRRTDSSSSSSSSSSSNAIINRVYNICSNNSNNNNNNNDNNSNNNNNNNNTNTNTDNHECCNQLISNRNRFISVSNNFNRLIKFIILLMLCSCCDLTQAALRNVNLYVEPPAVRRGQSVTLRCQYTLEGAPLYSVKFYRGQLEFFRYTPGEYPNTKVFHYPGIKVDESVSNATQVIIRNVSFNLSGNFACEVTADAPLFSTATAYAQMQVVEFPEKRPQLFTELTRYEPGDILRANCSTPPSRPRAELRFTINNMPVSSEETQYIRTVDSLIASRLSLKVQLQAIHFATAASNSHMINALSNAATGGAGSSGYGIYGTSASGIGGVAGAGAGAGASGVGSGGLLLRCTAQIGDLYQEYKEIELGTPQKDPIPARVTSSGGGFTSFLESYFASSAAPKDFKRTTTIINACFINYTIMYLFSYIRNFYGLR